MSEMVKIVVTYDMLILEDHQLGRIELSVPKRIAGILVYNRPCYDLDVANRNLYDVVNGVARLQGYTKATVSTIRYAKTNYPLPETTEA